MATTEQQLLAKFNQGIKWNAIFYVIYKAFCVTLTVLLFKTLSTQDFSIWANINSIIFLVLLWLDCGFRKSIPRYYPVYAQNASAHKHFLQSILIFQSFLLCAVSPIFFFPAKLQHILHLSGTNPIFFQLGGIVFISKGIVNMLHLMYHAHFWQKQFNLISTTAILAELSINAMLIFLYPHDPRLLHLILINKVVAGLITIAIAGGLLPRLYRDSIKTEHTLKVTTQTRNNFVKHSSIMWVNNNLKSLTERNFLFPLLTHLAGPESANLFKIANDLSLFFYRIVRKTISSADTALLSHVEVLPEKDQLLPIAFKKLATKIAGLCLPLLGLMIVMLVGSSSLQKNPYAFHIFIVLTVGYVLESLLSPYERVLEVKERYSRLIIAYMPYVVMIITVLSLNPIPLIGLLGFAFFIQGVRLVSSFLLVFFARSQYRLPFPFLFTIKLSLVVLCITLLLSYLLLHTCLVSYASRIAHFMGS